MSFVVQIYAFVGGFFLVIAIVLKLYLKCTMGVCKSTKRLDGKTVLITGGNTGIGKETALDLAKRGARIILACRDLKKAAAAKVDIIKETGNKDVIVMELDLASLASVRKCAEAVIQNEPKLNILINNAGFAEGGKKLTSDGLEQQMQTNHFGHFLLTNLLLDLIIQTGEKEKENARIINVSSEAHKLCKKINFEDINFTNDSNAGSLWSFFKIYGASKMCNILFTIELASKFQHHGNPVSANSLHPGAVFTEFGRFSKIFSLMMRVTVSFWKTANEGAQTTIYLAVADEVANITGQYFRDCKISKTSKLAGDSGIAKKLWELSETLVHLKREEKYF